MRRAAAVSLAMLGALSAARAADTAQLAQAAGMSAPGDYYHAWLYKDVDPLNRSGVVNLRLGEGTSLFAPGGPRDERLWALDYTTSFAGHGPQLHLNLADADGGVMGATSMGFAPGERGLRRADVDGAWKTSALNLSYGRDRTVDPNAGRNGAGVGLDRLAADSHGFSYRRDRIALDGALQLDDDAQARLLGKDGYDLADRKLGGASAGYKSLNNLAGLRDSYDAAAYKHGDLSAARTVRDLWRDGRRLMDEDSRAAFGALSVERRSRAVSAGLSGLSDAGYGDWKSLAGAREDKDSIALGTKLLAVNWDRTHTVHDGGASTTSAEGHVELKPVKGVSLAFTHDDGQDVTPGAAATPKAADKIDLDVKQDVHHLTVHAESDTNGVAAQRELDRQVKAAYELGKAAKLNYSTTETDTRGGGSNGADSYKATHTASLDTAAGLSLKGRYEIGTQKPDGWYHGAGLQRDLTKQLKLAANYDMWHQSGDADFAIAGRKQLLANPVDWAWAYKVGGTAKPGVTTVDAQYRLLRWQQPTDGTEFKAGEHALAETDVTVSQKLFLDLRARGAWMHYDKDDATDREKREAALGYAPGGDKKPVACEIGYRELRLGDTGPVNPSVFAAAHVGPWPGLALTAEVAQSTDANNVWTLPSRRELKVSAQQKFAGDGQAKVEYSRAPRQATAIDATTQAPLLRDVAVDVAAPSGWLVGGMKLGGRWHNRVDPGATGADQTALNEQSATLSWDGKDLGALSATYTQSQNTKNFFTQNETKLSVEYHQNLHEYGSLSVSAWTTDLAAHDDGDPLKEHYRVGVNYALPF
jgi:hypothetical protein